MVDMATSDSGMEKLNNDNFSTWSVRMQFYLLGEDLWGVVGGSGIVETSVENEKNREDEVQSQVPVDASAEDDDDTLADALQNFDEGNFDFERLLRAAVRKYAYTLIFISLLLIFFSHFLEVTQHTSRVAHSASCSRTCTSPAWALTHRIRLRSGLC